MPNDPMPNDTPAAEESAGERTGGSTPGQGEDRFYFRQLLAGRDFATSDPVAQQMVNFVYLIGDRATEECVVVDPAYGVAELAAIAADDGMAMTGALVTHYHPDHCGGSMMGMQIEGVTELLELHQMPVHVQAEEAEWVTKVTELTAADLTTHQSGDSVMVGRDPDPAAAHTGPHPREPVLLRQRRTGLGRHAVPGRLRTHRPARRRSRGAVLQPHPDPGAGARRRRALPRPHVLPGPGGAVG